MNHELYLEKLHKIKVPESSTCLEQLSIKAAATHDSDIELCHMALEEMAELQKEVLKAMRYPKESVGEDEWEDRRLRIAEEIGDVLITTRYLMHAFNITEDEVRAAMTVKLKSYLNETKI